ncbi:phosphoheptose isomerase 1 [Synechococcus phage S-CAM3]|uniref:Phosphoheptose isomerase 1 n=1 Tax=Synechococcus phage S-CAM3 TaxID=1883366 RepID=A0A1D8KKB2_9CAUD|nr:phosphoheptose isomerase [Synechococcus phage S-CAM3]AOV58613.1 phosphoheptose isomerase 1 [Synechococcus phage S-CAM3]AOV58852.1 phosphoheptose isomerase 1 [Synechococcus phage S-CAM3]AOV59091.1 phosphoheptose isomerase 1 [Synechococcus phage S-CAM3]
MIYVIDIDGTICFKKERNGYEVSVPIRQRIKTINDLYDQGNYIKYFTARGMGRHEGNASKAYTQFYTMTENQLRKWGCKYHELILGKPSGDIYIDDKGINDVGFFS